MSQNTRTIPSIAASAAALVFSAAAFAATPPNGSSGSAVGNDDVIHCYGVHSCKGQADCATTENACKGQNECNVHGFQALKAGECLTKGGTIGDIA